MYFVIIEVQRELKEAQLRILNSIIFQGRIPFLSLLTRNWTL